MRRAGFLLSVLGAVLAVVPATAAAAPGDPTGRIVVLADPGARAAVTAGVAGAGDVRPAGPAEPAIGMTTVRPASGVGLGAALRRLRRAPGVASAVPERRLELRDVPDDPALSEAETAPGTPDGLTREWWVERENFPAAWSRTHGDGAIVGVIDTGIDGTHPDLAGKVATTIDLDGDPTRGATTDTYGHGTHVASLACAGTDDDIGIAGAGWDCRLVVVKSTLTDATVAAGLVRAVGAGAKTINMSFGQPPGSRPSPVLARALRYAIDADVVLVAAAADEPITEQGSPANQLQPAGTGSQLEHNTGLSVTAADVHDDRASFAGRGSEISMAAYGAVDPDGDCGTLVLAERCGPPGLLGDLPASAAITGPFDACRCRTKVHGDHRYAYLQGTSMAAPQVTAAAALVRALNPDLSAPEVIRVLKDTARRDAAGWTPDLGWGILDAGAALDAAAAMDRRAPETRLHGPRHGRAGRVLRVRWSGGDSAPPGVAVAGLARVTLYAGRIGHPAHRVRRVVHRRHLRFRPRFSARYRLYTLGVDAQGNAEEHPSHVVRVRVRKARTPRPRR